MRIDFNEIDSVTFPGMDNGTGMMSARMYNDDSYRIIPTAIHPGVMHICPKGSEHSIVNTGEEDLVMLTIVVKK